MVISPTRIPTLTPCMTVGGTGDVLSGLTAGFLSRNKNMIESASAAIIC